MKKITFLALHMGFGGVERVIANQANALCRNFDVEIICAYRLYNEPPFYVDPRVRITYLMRDLKPNRDELKAAVRSLNPFAIAKQSLVAARVLRQRTALMREAVRELDSDVIISTRLLYHPVLARCARPGVVKVAQEHNNNGDERYISRICSAVRNFDFFMPVSRYLLEMYSERLDGSPVRCVYIPNSLDSWSDAPAPLTEKTVVAVGRFSPEKGFPDLVRVFAEFHAGHPDWRLALVGDGAEFALVRETAEKLGVLDAVTLYGYRDKAGVNEILRSASIYAMTSFREAFPLVLIEAQSHGLPCVAFDSAGGAAEIIDEGVSGFLVPGRDRALFAERLALLADDRGLRLRMGAEGRRGSEQYRAENVAVRLEAFYSAVTGSAAEQVEEAVCASV